MIGQGGIDDMAGGCKKGENLFMLDFLIFFYLKGQFKMQKLRGEYCELKYGVKHCNHHSQYL